MGLSPFCLFTRGDDCIVAAAIHNGHDTRLEIETLLAIGDEERAREEDPFTGALAQVAKIQLIGLRSRFEFDLNRPREKAVYHSPDEAWGLETWKSQPERAVEQRSLQEYDAFYRTARELLTRLLERHERLVVLDLHSYNHRRDGADAPPAPAELNPDINVGTGSLDRQFWAPIVDRIIRDLRNCTPTGQSFDVRENVRFQGGEFCRWIHQMFPFKVCALAIEVKKFFMDEWTGKPDLHELERVFLGLQSTLPGLRESLKGVPA